jgi:hypothetical protein
MATVDYLVVNRFTKQLYWADTDNPPGWIGWEYIPDGVWKTEIDKYTKLGYSFTHNPLLIEEWLASCIVVFSVIGFIFNRRKKRAFNEVIDG